MKEDYIAVLQGKAVAKVKVSDIVFIERDRRKLHLVTEKGTYDYYERMENVEPVLDQRFYPCLKGCYINLDKVESMQEQRISFDNGEFLYIGRENFIRTRQYYKKYLKNKMNRG